jgi:hypothetical protein
MSTGEQKKPPLAGVEGFKQAAAQLKGPRQGFDLLERMGQLPASTRLQLPLVDFDPFAAASLPAESPEPWQALPVKASENGSSEMPDASRIRGRSPSTSSARSDPPEREQTDTAASPRRHPTATGRNDRGEKQPAGPAPVSVPEPDRINAEAAAGVRHSGIRSRQAADPSPIRRNNTSTGSSSDGLQEIAHGSPPATALKQLDEVTTRLLALNIRSGQNSPPSRSLPSSPDPPNADRTPMITAPLHASPALAAHRPPPGRNRSPGKYGSTPISGKSTEDAQPKVTGSGGGDRGLREHSVLNAAERHYRFQADGHQSAISSAMALLDKLTGEMRKHTSSSSPETGAASHKNPSMHAFVATSASLPSNDRIPNTLSKATMGAAQATDPLGPDVDVPALMRHQSQDTHLAAERLTDLINDVLVSQARRHGADV